MDPEHITRAGLGTDPALSYANRMSKSTFEWSTQGREEPFPAGSRKDRAGWSWGGWVERWWGRSVEGGGLLCQRGLFKFSLFKAWDVTIILYQSLSSLAWPWHHSIYQVVKLCSPSLVLPSWKQGGEESKNKVCDCGTIHVLFKSNISHP